jgi:hypothetical protein
MAATANMIAKPIGSGKVIQSFDTPRPGISSRDTSPMALSR